jgi:flagellar hook protein FlgE
MSLDGQNIDGFSTALSGLNAQQAKLEMVGNNIANINTIGFKSTRMTFAEQFGSTIGISFTPFKQGGFQSTGNVTDLGIKGSAFFVLEKNDELFFTRDGSFSFDKDGVFVNGQGYSVQGWAINPKDNTKKSNDLGDIIIDRNLLSDAQATKNIHLTGNLNAGLKPENEVWSNVSPLTVREEGIESLAVEESELNDLNQTASSFQSGETIHISGTNREGNEVGSSFIFGDVYDGTTIGDLVEKINGIFGNDSTVQLLEGKIVLTDIEPGESNSSINIVSDEQNTGEIEFPGFANITSGYTPKVTTSMVIYDSLGKAHELTVQYEKTVNTGEWKVMIEANGSETVLSGGSGILTFDENGRYLNFEFIDESSEFVLDPGNNTPQLNINFNMDSHEGFSGITQFDSVSNLSLRSQDGNQAGALTGFNVDESGIIKGIFTNGKVLDLAQIGTTTFQNDNGLRKVGGSLFMETKESGPSDVKIPDENASSIESGVLEMSNVDLANQFTQMIEAQRGFQATSRVVTTLNEVMNEASRLKG